MQILLHPVRQEQLILLAAVLLRLLVGLSSYSGAGRPPKYGDYEAQRHWMEVAVHLPPSQWYTDSEFMNSSYWPLDYPPLSGYQSYVHGKLLQAFEPQAVALTSSHGYETPSSKLLMRLTVISSDMLVFFPAALACVRALYGAHPSPRRAFALAAILLNPAALIIDHGHFQFNCISLGLTVAAVASIVGHAHVVGSVLFCLALSHKQMALYYAPAFFGHLLGRCLQKPTAISKVACVLKLGVAVILTFAVAWYPWASESPQALVQVLRRIFPLKRGLYEDYVANFWCTSSVVLKWKQLVDEAAMAPLCALVTLAAALPSVAHQVWHPSARGLLMAMANSAFAFFMFSYQVHEKSILLPLLPVTLLAGFQPATCLWLVPAALASMFPLLERDGLSLPYMALLLLWCGTVWPWGEEVACGQQVEIGGGCLDKKGGDANKLKKGDSLHSSEQQQQQQGLEVVGKGSILFGVFSEQGRARGKKVQVALKVVSISGLLGLHCARASLPPPGHLPWLYDRAFITGAFLYLGLIDVYLQVIQWSAFVPGSPTASDMKAKQQ